jgi:hypothetical protein
MTETKTAQLQSKKHQKTLTIITWQASTIKNSIFKLIPLLLLIGCSNAIAQPETLKILTSVEQIRALTDAPFYDNKVAVDINGDGNQDSVIYYSYSKLGPAQTCDTLDNCEPETTSIITFYIDLPEGRSHIDVMCDSIGVYQETSNLQRDIFCGPNTRLYWNGKKYIENKTTDQ